MERFIDGHVVEIEAHDPGGEGTGPNPTDRSKCGWKWSVAADGRGLPIGWAIDGANRNDLRTRHRHAALCLATVVLIVGRLIDWRSR